MSHIIKILLVDDHAVVRAGYRLLLSRSDAMEIVAEAETGEEACQLYVAVLPDVVVMDLSMPGIGGLSCIRRILSRDKNAKILVFSIHNEPVYINRALEAGAKGYLTKNSAPDILVDAVNKIAAGEVYIDPDIVHRLPGNTEASNNSGNPLESLSAREFDVFCLLAKGHTTREVAAELCLGFKTVANYNTLIKNKLGISTTAEMARLAMQNGLLDY